MRWLLILLLFTSCGSQKAVIEERRAQIVRCDTVGARFADEFHIQLHDVVIFPSDSTLARVTVKEVELNAQKQAEVIAESRQILTADTQKSSTISPSSPQPSKFLLYLIILLLLYLLISRK